MEDNEASTEKLEKHQIHAFITRFRAGTGIDPGEFSIGEIVDMANEHNRQRQIDRACAAQSPEMLPKDEMDEPLEDQRKQIEQTINRFFD